MTFRLDTITLAGIGEYGSPPAYFNRLNPRRDPDKFIPKPGRGRDVFALPLHEYVMERRGTRSSAEGIRLDCEHRPFCRVDLRLPTGGDVTGESCSADDLRQRSYSDHQTQPDRRGDVSTTCVLRRALDPTARPQAK